MTHRSPPLRLLTAVPICDGHDSAINTLNLEFIRHGMEVIYLGYHRSVSDIVRAAIQEDVSAVGISSYNGGHIEFFQQVRELLNKNGGAHIGLFGGGGGTITHEDAEQMCKLGVDRIFFAGTPLEEMVDWIKQTYSHSAQKKRTSHTEDSQLATALTHAEIEFTTPVADPLNQNFEKPKASKVIGFTGPGGAGKTTLIDELVFRFLRSAPKDKRIAILSHDPSIVGAGALLGDRATMIYSQNDRVFMRSMATRGQAGGLSPATGKCLEILATSGQFDTVIIETVGTGQEAMPFGTSFIDHKILVMNPDYGSRLQLQKIAMLDLANLVVVNKGDLRGAKTASAEIESRLKQNHQNQKLYSTTANSHGDTGVDALFHQLF